MSDLTELFKKLARQLEGDLYTDIPSRLIHATDASIYRELPFAVARPMHASDMKKLVSFARDHKLTLIPRAAGTSLAGQVVGEGIIVDVSKYLTNILEINEQEKWVRVQPGVVLDELNAVLAEKELFFAPETSTSNRCMIGGMVGNNACGSHSLIYGSTRDHIRSIRTILSDGSEVEFGPVKDYNVFMNKISGGKLENLLYRNIYNMLSDPSNQEEIRNEFPDPEVKRRNTGYALDVMLEMNPFSGNGKPFNFASLLTGSEGTLALMTEITLNLIPLPPAVKGLLCVHLETLEEALEANLVCLEHHPDAVELMDRTILEYTAANREQLKNRFFVQGDPGAILIVEFAENSLDEVASKAHDLEEHLRTRNLGYHYPLITGSDISKVWALRKSGLGVLSNIPGDAKPVSLVEDTAVRPDLLPAYVQDFKNILAKYGLHSVYHAHIGTGELHMRPVMNLRKKENRELMQNLAREVAELVKQYRGSLSGEHGDGRLRSEFLSIIVGNKNHALMQELKHTWDPEGIFNRGKIIDPLPMNEHLRYRPLQNGRKFTHVFSHSPAAGMLEHAEKCNGSGDCRKSALMGGTMCPSYMATRDEYTTTRARANLLREYLVNGGSNEGPDAHAVYDILDLCLSCKGCKSECPSNVDMAKLKAEFLQHFYDKYGIPFNLWLVAHLPVLYKVFHKVPGLFNLVSKSTIFSPLVKRMMGFSLSRDIPLLAKQDLRKWIGNQDRLSGDATRNQNQVYLFLDEFTNYTDTSTGMAAYQLLNKLGYRVQTLPHPESGRTYLSKGMVHKAKTIARENISRFASLIREDVPLIGIEPSALLTFRDEYIDLAGPDLHESAVNLSKNCMLIDEFIAAEYKKGHIQQESFTREKHFILVHGHCQQKAIASTVSTLNMLSIPVNYSVQEIKSGCCGMAGSFGYEKNHYEISMKIGALSLFPAVRNADENTIICAGGTSCRQQIEDGTGKKAFHPVEVLFRALL